MRFGAVVRVHRGSEGRRVGPGRDRWVRGVLVGARGRIRFVRLLDDDPDDISGWRKAGDVGHWEASSVEEVR